MVHTSLEPQMPIICSFGKEKAELAGVRVEGPANADLASCRTTEQP